MMEYLNFKKLMTNHLKDMHSKNTKKMLSIDTFASNLYESVVTNKFKTPFINELQHFGKTKTQIVFSTPVEHRDVLPKEE